MTGALCAKVQLEVPALRNADMFFFGICEAATGESTRAAACAIGKAGADLFCVILVQYLNIFQSHPLHLCCIFQSRPLFFMTPIHDFGILSCVVSMLATD